MIKINKTVLLRFLSYVFFSGLAALVNFGSRFLFELIPGVEFIFAVVLAYTLGMIVNFIFSKLIVFQSAQTGKTQREAIKFFAVALIGLLVTVLVSAMCLEALNSHELPLIISQNFIGIQKHSDTLAHLTGMAVGLAANFLGHELISFKETGLWNKINNRLQK